MASYKITTDYPKNSEVYLNIVRRFRALLSGMAMVKDDGKTAVIKTITQGESIYCKRFRHGGIINSIKNQFRPSKAKTSYFAAKEASKRGIPVPEHFTFVEKRTAGFLINSYVFTRTVKDALPLQFFIKEKYPFSGRHNPQGKRRFINEIASFTAQIHTAGMIHNDLKATNIIVNEDGNNFDFHVLDLDNVSFSKTVPMKIIIRNLVQLNNDCMYVCSINERLRFFINYLQKAKIKMSRSEKNSLAQRIELLTLKKVERWQNETKKLKQKGKSKHRDDSINLNR